MNEEHEEYQLVSNVEILSDRKLTFSVRNPYVIEKPKGIFRLVGLFFLTFTCIALCSVFIFLGLWPLALLGLLVPIALSFDQSGTEEVVPVSISLDEKLNQVDLFNSFLGANQSLSCPHQLRITACCYPLTRKFNIYFITVDLVGGNQQLESKVCISHFRHNRFSNVQNEKNNAASAFKFLADWLKIPIVVEEKILHCNGKTKDYFQALKVTWLY